MELAEVLFMMNQMSMDAMQLTDLRVGTVESISPLSIKMNSNMDALRKEVLLLTAPVVEKKIPILKHKHRIQDTFSGGGTCEEVLEQIVCYENGQPLPVKNGFIILNRGLEVGDKVLMLRVQHGQKYIILSRIF